MMKSVLRKISAITVGAVLSFAFAFGGCAPKEEKPKDETPVHTHTFESGWTTSETEHWHKATCEHKEETSERAEHDFGSGDVCTVCGYERKTQEHTHSFSEEWTKSETEHWHASVCGHPDEVSERAAHNFGSGDVCTVCGYEREPAKPAFAVNYRDGYAPAAFSGVTNEVTELAPGVHLVANTMTLTGKGNYKCVVYTVEVNLEEANIVAGTKDNRSFDSDFGHATPYAMAQAWENATGGQVYASINADFFNPGDSHGKCVNAFVKDGFIIKAAHNDNNRYDYGDASDVPASAPMLFGVKGTKAQIAPIQAYTGDVTSPEVKEALVKAELFYQIKIGETAYAVRENETPGKDFIAYRTSSAEIRQRNGIAVKVDTTGGVGALKALEVKKISSSTSIAGGEGYAWLQTTATSGAIYSYLNGLKVGDAVTPFSVASPDGLWDGFETILGCRQALVLDDKVADTVKLEPSNGAQLRDIPRTAVGLKPDGTVVLFAVESLWYGKDKTDGVRVETDTHGMNLPELAEFAYFYGCNVAANFDGGGSTQLTVRGEGEETPRVLVRSSDYGVADVNKSRVVVNAFLITSRKEG